MRIAVGCLFVAAASGAVAPASLGLHGRYGEPDLERFTVQPGIELTVEYGSGHSACRVLIEAAHPFFTPEESIPLMAPGTVTEILQEIAPVQLRGMSIGTSVSSMGCDEARRTEYQDLRIDRQWNNCLALKPEREVRAKIQYKRDVCRKPEKPQ
jgi:hypothetical protein